MDVVFHVSTGSTIKMILTSDAFIVMCVVIGGLGFVAGWFGAWIVGAFKNLTQEEKEFVRRLNK
jgi:uncharacterized membrane protein YgdD (TMEM256/DUF423 family)